ncbi:MAG TPA: hypothetical protein VGM53_31010 [Streptosporangiaceae bacterium]
MPEKLHRPRGEGDPLISPDAAVAHNAARAGVTLAELGVAPVVITVWGRRLFDGLRSRLDAAPLRHWWYGQRVPHVVGLAGEQPVSLVLLPVGAPGTVMIMEELIAAGARAFLGFGLAGGLQSHCGPGTAVQRHSKIDMRKSPFMEPHLLGGVCPERCAGTGREEFTWHLGSMWRIRLAESNFRPLSCSVQSSSPARRW